MSKVESNFHADSEAEFRFRLVLESASVEAHSLMDSGDNKKLLQHELNELAHRLLQSGYADISKMIREWKDKHK